MAERVRGNPEIPLNVGLNEGIRELRLTTWNYQARSGVVRQSEEAMFWKIVGGLILAWVAFMVLGSVLGFLVKAVFWIAIIGGAVFLGTAAYGAIKGKSNPKQLR